MSLSLLHSFYKSLIIREASSLCLPDESVQTGTVRLHFGSDFEIAGYLPGDRAREGSVGILPAHPQRLPHPEPHGYPITRAKEEV